LSSALVGELLHIRRDLGLPRRGQHLPRNIPLNLIKQRPLAGLVAAGLIGILNTVSMGPPSRTTASTPVLIRTTGLSDHPREECAYSHTAPPRLIQRF
jgi:hypothetical protein